MPSLPDAELRRRREQAVIAHAEAENRGDVEAVIAGFAHARYDVVPGGVHDGAEAVRALLGEIFSAFPDFHSEILEIYHAETAVIVESQTTGTHTGTAWFGIEPIGRRMDMRAVSIYEFDGERMTCEKLFFDGLGLQQQLTTGPGSGR